jgi:hypothetical protein
LSNYRVIEIENLPLVLNISDIQAVLRIGKSQAYELAKRTDFPKLPIDKPIRVPRDEFLRWAGLLPNKIKEDN